MCSYLKDLSILSDERSLAISKRLYWESGGPQCPGSWMHYNCSYWGKASGDRTWRLCQAHSSSGHSGECGWAVRPVISICVQWATATEPRKKRVWGAGAQVALVGVKEPWKDASTGRQWFMVCLTDLFLLCTQFSREPLLYMKGSFANKVITFSKYVPLLFL